MKSVENRPPQLQPATTRGVKVEALLFEPTLKARLESDQAATFSNQDADVN